MKLNYLIIPLITIVVAAAGSWLTGGGMTWYKTINLPSWTPPGSLIGLVWTVIFILTTISALLVYNKSPQPSVFWLIMLIFIINGVLNMAWSWLFFGQHWLYAAIWEASILGLSVLVLIIMTWPVSLIASLLLIPYVAWVTFATYVTYSVWLLNK